MNDPTLICTRDAHVCAIHVQHAHNAPPPLTLGCW